VNAVLDQLKWTEREAQDVVYIHCAIKNHELMVPNSCLFVWEADLLSVTRSGFIHEFEIKISRADFKADAKKDRTKLLLDPVLTRYGRPRTVSRPNYFSYAVPKGLISPDEAPDYAGLIYLNEFTEGHSLDYRIAEVIKEPKRIHSEKITDGQRRQLCRALIHRFWPMRLKANRAKREAAK
jgi:hypothetical protein